jgi:hypothetical protein
MVDPAALMAFEEYAQDTPIDVHEAENSIAPETFFVKLTLLIY